MQQAVDEDGVIWNVDAQGNAVGAPVGRVDQPQAPQQTGPAPFTVGTPRAPEAPKPPSGYQWTPGGLAPIPGGPASNQAPSGYQFGPDGTLSFIPGGPADPAMSPANRDGKSLRQGDGTKLSALIDQYAGLKNAALGFQDDFAGNAIGGEVENWAQGILGTGTPGQRDWWSAFRSTDNLIRNDLFGASLTDGEKRAYEQTTVSPSMRPEIVRQNVQRRVEILRKGLERNVDRFRAAGFNEAEIEALAGEYAPDLGVGKPWRDQAPKFELPRAVGVKPAASMQVDGATGRGGVENIPELAGMENQVIDLIGKGASREQIVGFMNQQLAPYDSRVGADMEEWLGERIQEHQADPSKPVRSLGSGWEMLRHRKVPESDSTLLGRAADTGPGNALMNGINSLFAGAPAWAAGKQDALSAANEERPGWAAGGKIAGSLGAMGGISAAAKTLGGAGSLLTRGGGVGGDMLYGGVQGGLEGGPGGIIPGVVAAGVGNKVGSSIVSGTGRALRGVSDPVVKRLSAQGVPLTSGMIMGRNSLPGNMMNLLESAPGIRGLMARRYQDAEEGVFRAALNDSVEGIGGKVKEVGTEGLAQAYDASDTAYANALKGRSFQGNDPQFLDDMEAAIARGEEIPELGPQFSHAIRKDIKPLFSADGTLTGERLQDALQFLRKRRASYGEHPLGSDIGEAFDDVGGAITGMASRQIPEVVPQLNSANEAYRKINILSDAAKGAVNRGGNPTPAQINRASANNTTKYLGKRAAVTGQRPFQQLGDDAQKIIPSKVGDSGTASRVAAMALPFVLGSGATGADYAGAGPAVTIPLATLAMLTSKTGARVAQKALTGDRPASVAKVGNALVKHKRKAGLFGASVAPYLAQ